MFGLVVRFDLKDEDAARPFDQLVAETVRHVRSSEPGTLVYAPHSVVDEPLGRVFYELYRDREAFEEHGRQPHTQRLLTECKQYVAGSRFEFLIPGSGKGIG